MLMNIGKYENGNGWDHISFYKKANSTAEIFKCIENGNLYIPGENDWFCIYIN